MHCTNCGQEIASNAAVCTHCGVAVGTEKKFCANCGQAVNANQAICLGCGSTLQQTGAAGQKMILPNGKSASTALILSCLIAGLGQIYFGQTLKGLVILAVTCLTGPIGWVIGMIDAYLIGKKLESNQAVGEWEFF